MTQITRRSLFQGAGAAGIGIGLATAAAPPQRAHAVVADEFDALRDRWVQQITIGPGFDHTQTPFSTELAAMEAKVQQLQADMDTGSSTALWSDLPISGGGNMVATYLRLLQMAIAWATPHSGVQGDTAVLDDIKAGLDWVRANAYSPTIPQGANWYDWRIAAPKNLLTTMAIIYPHLSSTQIAQNLDSVDTHSPDWHLDTLLSNKQSTGANRAELAMIRVYYGIVAKSATKIERGVSDFAPLFRPVRSNDGFYEDGSFIQHVQTPYLANYGRALLISLATSMALLKGSTWEIDDENLPFIYDMFDRGIVPFMFNGLVMDNQAGRRVARGISVRDARRFQMDEHNRGHDMISALLLLAEASPSTEAQRIRSHCKGWLQREYWGRFMDDFTQGVANWARAKQLTDDSSVDAADEPVASRVFGASDRAVHRREEWAFAIAMCSARTTFYTCINGENVHGWHTNAGVTYWWGKNYGNGQYSDAFWPTVDPYRLPGTTVSRKPLADAQGGYRQAVPSQWAGGATDGTFAAVGQDVRGLDSTLEGKKSWFCLADQVVCLGAGISSDDGYRVETTIENRNLGETASPAFTVDGVVQSAALPTETAFAAASWASIQGHGGYVFPGGAAFRVRREARTGAWSDINVGGSAASDSLTRRYLTMWFDHGQDPSAGSYAYIVMPGATPTATSDRAAHPTVEVLANTANVQAVTDSATGVTAANFFAAGTAGPITVSAPCSVLIRETGGKLSVSVADPSQKSSTVKVTIDRTGRTAFTLASTVSEISIVRNDAKLEIIAEVGACLGASRTITFGTGSAISKRTSFVVGPAADATVRDGAYSGTNYGGDSLLVVKNSTAGYHRRAYLKFDLSSVSGTPRRAVLWVYGKTSDSNGTEATLTANRCSTDEWTESGVNWSNKPPFSGAQSTCAIGEIENWLAFDVTTLVAAQASDDGVVTIGLSGALGGNLVQLNSRAATEKKPYLQVLTS